MEHFYTLQGEGFNAGRAAYFIRLGGCDVGCVWCDVKESWDANAHPHFSLEEIKFWITGTPAIVVTGGEPTLYNLTSLTDVIKQAGAKAWIETSGTNEITGDWDWICLSPKKFKAPLESELAKADELKIIVFHPSDLSWAEQFLHHLKPDCQLYLQPEWSKREMMEPLCIDYIKANPAWRLSLQTHKYLDIP